MKNLRQVHHSLSLLANIHGFRTLHPSLVSLRNICSYNGKDSHNQLVRWRTGNSYGLSPNYLRRSLALDPKAESAKKTSVEIHESGVAILTMQVPNLQRCLWISQSKDDNCADPRKV
jgi:hypothetical protein